MDRFVYLIATMDSKGIELEYTAQCLRSSGVAVRTVDVSTKDAPLATPDITRDQVLACHPCRSGVAIQYLDRGEAVALIGEALTEFLRREYDAGRVSGVLSMGGTGGTSLVSPALRSLPVGVPKVIVSTVASGYTSPYVGCSDVLLFPSVVDVAGLNIVSRQILANAAGAIAGMITRSLPESEKRFTVGLSMFGVTTPCVTEVRRQLEDRKWDCLTFHATGTGGQAMEKLVESGLIDGVLDVTTTEVADEVVGGVFKAGPCRFDAIFEAGVPYVMSLGALDMVNFGAIETVPQSYRGRKLHVHNPQVTLMRTTPDENRQIAKWIAGKVNRSVAPFILLIPEGGISLLDVPGKPFYDPESDRALFEELERTIQTTATRQIRRVPANINDPEFAAAMVDAFDDVM